MFTSSSTEASSITGLNGEPPPLLTPSIISATETKCVAWYQSSQGNVKESLHEKQKNRKKGKRVENNPPVGHKISIATCNCSVGRDNMLKAIDAIPRGIPQCCNYSDYNVPMQSRETISVVQWARVRRRCPLSARNFLLRPLTSVLHYCPHIILKSSYKFSVDRLIFLSTIVRINLLAHLTCKFFQ